MPFIAYQKKKFSASSKQVIDNALKIIEEYSAQRYDLTLRQLYYQFVSRDLIKNNQKEYKRLGSIINDARLAGMIDWDTITDRTRNLKSNSHWSSPKDIIQTCASQFRYDIWVDQPHRIEVWIEKDALAGVFERICRNLDIAYFSCRGYTSQSEMWAAAQRLKGYVAEGQEPVVLHFGDHDPSGIDMSRDITDRIQMFMQDAGHKFQLERLALNWNQIEEYNPPPNPAKITDSRFDSYEKEYGSESWELDALEPSVLVSLVENNVASFCDRKRMDNAIKRQHDARSKLALVAVDWDTITKQY